MLFFLPYVLAEIATGLIFSFVYDGNYGLLASIWRLFGAEAPHLLASPQTSMLAILIVIVWKYFGFHMMLYIAALQGIDRSLIEAARIDGASRFELLRYVVIPLLSPTIRLSVFFSVVGSLQLFDLVMPLTRGGPADSSQHHGELPLQFRRHAHARGLRQRRRRHPVLHLRHLRLHLQALDDAR